MSKQPLPIDLLLPQIIEYIKRNTISIIRAEPGAGKTTRVPAALLEYFDGSIYVLEPRRLAARLAAGRVAEELGQPIGQTVGYQIRFDQVGGRDTRLWYLTEGVLTRKLMTQRRLPGTAVVLLDEFHERHVETDLALALLRYLRAEQPDLRIVLMSATLQADELAAQLGGAAVSEAPGRTFPVAIRYKPNSAEPLENQVAAAVSEAVSETQGHVLVFLPGSAEIRRAIAACESLARRTGSRILPLYGDLPPEQQDEAVSHSAVRKIIFATNVAESSVTIDGVAAIVDSGLARLLTHSAWSGLSRLEVKKISQASAIQRAGRAGRTQSGIAIRLYSESDFVRRPKDLAPEIFRADLAPLCLQLASADISWDDLPWLDAAPAELVSQAKSLLERLGATDFSSKVTSLGRRMAGIAVHPRLARFLVAAAEMSVGKEACEVAARLSRDRLSVNDAATHSSDLEQIGAAELDYSSRRLRDQLLRSVASIPVRSRHDHALERALLLGYPDRVARRRGGTLTMSQGNSTRLHPASSTQGEFLVAIEVENRAEQATPVVRLAAAIEPDWLLDYFPGRIETRDDLVWNRDSERVEQVSSLRYDSLVIDETRSPPTNLAAASEILVAKALEAGIERFVESDELNGFLNRVRFAQQHMRELTLPDDLVISALRRIAAGVTGFRELRDATRGRALLSALEAELPMRLIDEIAPTHVVLPGGRRARIEYHGAQPPSVASRLQDFFGMTESPSVARGSVPLVVQLLAPNHRPVQVTTDLPSFWKNLYPQLRRELGRRYPRHSWPEDPASALWSK